MSNITVSCTNISKSFANGDRSIKVLDKINLEGHQKEMIMLMGPSGSGKTTLISIIGGILTQDSGECLVLGKAINQLPEREKTLFRGTNIGFMFQNSMLVPTLNARENAAIPLLCLDADHDQALAQADRLLTQLGLGQRLYNMPDQLSGGEQQRIAIVRAWIHNPKIILCDEPTGFLDASRGKQIMELLTQIKLESNCTIIVVTHDYRILSFADSILEIEDGKITKKR